MPIILEYYYSASLIALAALALLASVATYSFSGVIKCIITALKQAGRNANKQSVYPLCNVCTFSLFLIVSVSKV